MGCRPVYMEKWLRSGTVPVLSYVAGGEPPRPYVAVLSHAVKEKAVAAQDFAPHSTGVQALHLPRLVTE